MLSLTVICNGQRKVVKVATPNTLMQVILVEAAQHFNLDPKACILKHKRSTVDVSQPFRFSNLSNNAQLDLEVGSGATAKNASCRIALSVDGLGAVSGVFDSNLSLYDMLQSLISEGKLPANTFSMEPEIIYMRTSFNTEDLFRTTTFTSLGLSGQAARLQLRFLNKGGGSGAAESSVSVSSTPMEVVQEDTAPAQQNSESLPTSNSVAETANASQPQDTNTKPDLTRYFMPSQSVVKDSETEQASESVGVNQQAETEEMTADRFISSGGGPNVAAEIARHFMPSQNIENSENSAAEGDAAAGKASAESPKQQQNSQPKASPVQKLPPPPTATELLSKMMTQNFDSVTVPAVVTITKYLINILNNCGGSIQENFDISKYLTIKTSNKTFQEKVYPCNGGIELLYCIGFQANNDNSALTIPQMAPTIDSCFTHMINVYEALHKAMEELNIPVEKRPFRDTSKNIGSSGGAAVATAAAPVVVAFDPFKSSIVRTAQQPVRVESETEKQLAALNKRRLEIEGDVNDVMRMTEVIFPAGNESISNTAQQQQQQQQLQAMNEPDDSTAGGSGAGSGAVPKSLISKILQKPGSDDTPLTTKAVRDLQRAQKERVYAKTLVRVRFPDRVVLQGYFHPRHTITDVYDWVHSNIVTVPEGGGADYSLFELYVSPPRTVLSPFPQAAASQQQQKTAAQKNATCGLRFDNDDDASDVKVPTLTELKLVPAALIHLSWNDAHPLVGEMRAAGLLMNTTSSTAAVSAVSLPGRYLVDSLLSHSQSADSKQHSGDDGPTAAGVSGRESLYPTGAALVPTASSTSSSSSSSSSGGGSGSGGAESKGYGGYPDKSGSEKKTSGAKPKWFKI